MIFNIAVAVDMTELWPPAHKLNKYLMTKLWKWSMDGAAEPRFPDQIDLS